MDRQSRPEVTAARTRQVGWTSRFLDLWQRTLERYLSSDGTSHTRALAFQKLLALIPGFIGFMGLVVSVVDLPSVRATALHLSESLLPGTLGRLLKDVVDHGSEGAPTAMLLGLGACLSEGTLAMGAVRAIGEQGHG